MVCAPRYEAMRSKNRGPLARAHVALGVSVPSFLFLLQVVSSGWVDV